MLSWPNLHDINCRKNNKYICLCGRNFQYKLDFIIRIGKVCSNRALNAIHFHVWWGNHAVYISFYRMYVRPGEEHKDGEATWLRGGAGQKRVNDAWARHKGLVADINQIIFFIFFFYFTVFAHGTPLCLAVFLIFTLFPHFHFSSRDCFFDIPFHVSAVLYTLFPGLIICLTITTGWFIHAFLHSIIYSFCKFSNVCSYTYYTIVETWTDYLGASTGAIVGL